MRSSKKLFKKKCAEKVGSSDASSNTLQDQGRKVHGNLSHFGCSQDKIRIAPLKPTNLPEIVWKKLFTDDEDHIARKRTNSLNHYSLVHKFILMPKATKISDAKSAVDKECEKLEKILAWQLTKVRNKNEVIAEAMNECRKVHFSSLMDLCHLKNLWGSRSRQESPHPFWRSAQARYGPQGSGRSAGGSARDKRWTGRWGSRREWRTQGRRDTLIKHGWNDVRNTLEPCSAMWIMTTRTSLTKRTAHSHVSVHVRCVEGVLGLGGHVVIGVVLGFTTHTKYPWWSRCHWCRARFHHAYAIPSTSQTVFCDRQFLPVAIYCTLLHRENGSFEVLSLQNSELEPQFQKYKGRVVLRGDIVKNDSGSYAVFTEQGSQASQKTAAKVMDIMSRLPGCSGQKADAVSAYTQVKMEDAPKIIKSSKVGMSRHLDSSTMTQLA